MAIRGVLVDMGGVVLDMENPQGSPGDRLDWRGREALLHLVRDKGGHIGLDELGRLVFDPWRHGYKRRRELGREERWDPHLKRLRKKARIRTPSMTLLGAWFRPYGEHLQPIAGAPGALAALVGRGLQLALVSNVPLPGKLYSAVLKRHGLLEHFSSFQFSYDTGSRKPSPAMLRSALADLDLSPTEAVMVGDRRDFDVAAGRAAGTSTVWIRSDDGGGPAADYTIGALADLPALLGRWG